MRERVLSWYRELRYPEMIEVPDPEVTEATEESFRDIIRENELIRNLYDKAIIEAARINRVLDRVAQIAKENGGHEWDAPTRRYKAQTALDLVAKTAALRRFA